MYLLMILIQIDRNIDIKEFQLRLNIAIYQPNVIRDTKYSTQPSDEDSNPKID